MSQDTPSASLDLIYSITRELVSSLDLQVVLSRILALSVNNVGAERGSLIAINESNHPVSAALIIDAQPVPSTVQELQAILDHGLAGWVVRERKPAMVEDTKNDERWFQRPDDSDEQTGSKSAICIPLLITGGQLAGVLTIVHPEPGFFNQEHLSLLQITADIAGSAIYNALIHEELLTSQRRYLELFESSHDSILITDWKGSILEANRQASAMTGYDPVELRLCSIYLLHEVDLEWLNDHSQALHNNQTVSYESDMNTRSGEIIAIETYVQRVNMDGGEYLQWSFRDISEKRSLDLLKEDLLATIYHDLRSPLSNVVSCLDMIGTNDLAQTDPSIRQILGIANRSVDRLQRLISSLLDINRFETGKTLENREDTDPAILISEVVEAVWVTAESKKLTISLVLPGELPHLEMDRDMIKRVFFNLIENAIKFTPNGGLVTVGANDLPGEVQFWVNDNGPGIPDEAKDKIFDKFTRIKVQGGPKGVGLGLAFCRLAVKAHSGRIWVESELGRGSRFIFSLPKITK